jgi:hypothetical protein
MTRPPHGPHRIEDCRWSVPSVRRKATADGHGEFETYWTCERTRLPVEATPERCAACPHWAAEHAPAAARHRRD